MPLRRRLTADELRATARACRAMAEMYRKDLADPDKASSHTLFRRGEEQFRDLAAFFEETAKERQVIVGA